MSQNAKPNVLFFFTDQQRWDTCNCYGQPVEGVTPNLDRMAAEGVRFEHAFTCQPVCGPARACLQTGKFATEMGVFKNHIGLPQDEKTVAHWMIEAGYEAAYIGKWHLASTGAALSPTGEEIDYREKGVPLELRGGYKDYWLASDVLEFTSHGYDGYMFNGDCEKVEFKGYRAERQTDWAIDYLKNKRSEDKPFFLFLSYIEPHHQNDHNCYEGPEGSKERFKDFVTPGDLMDTGGDWRENYPDYLGCIHALDEGLGRIMDELESQGILDDTLIVFTSDHGSHFCTRNGEYKRSCHEGCLRIPMVARGPGFRGGKVVDDLVSLIDVPPTIVAESGLTPPYSMQGRPLQGLANGSATDWTESVFAQISESHVGRTVRTKKWKYAVWAPDKQGGRDMDSDVYEEAFLYDLEEDPHEKNNLVREGGEYVDVRAELAETLKRWMVKAGEEVPEIRPNSGTVPGQRD